MPSIHVIFDPKDNVRPPRADELRHFKVAHITLAVSEDMSKEEAAGIAKAIDTLLFGAAVAKIARAKA